MTDSFLLFSIAESIQRKKLVAIHLLIISLSGLNPITYVKKAVEPLIDMGCTSVNVFGNSLSISKSISFTGELDKDMFNESIDNQTVEA